MINGEVQIDGAAVGLPDKVEGIPAFEDKPLAQSA